MSGFEVAGLVLGVLPLAIQALKTYKDIMSDVKRVPNDLANLIEDLETEMLRLRTSCELLLEQIVPFDDIADYLDDPMSPKWEKSAVNNKLRIRLSDSYPKFEEKMRDIQAVGLDLEKKLRLREKMLEKLETRSFNERKAEILRIWKAKIGFTLKKKDYNDIITRLKSANTFLHNLVKDSRVLGPSRKRQSYNKIIRLLRNLAQSLFDALRGAATSCYCPQPHKACLELVVRDLAFIRKLDTEDQLAKKVPFYVVLTSMVSDKTLTECDEPEKPSQFNVRWTSFRVQCGDFDTPLSSQPTLTHATNSTASLACSESTLWTSPGDESEKSPIKILSSPPSNTRRKLSSLFKGHGKTVTFDSISATQKLVQVSTPTASLRVSSPQPHRVSISDSPLSNLCQLTVNKGKKPASTKDQCHGWIMDSTKGRRFGLYPPRWNDDISVQPMHVQPRSDTSEVRTSFTLRQILDHNNLRDSTSGPGLIPNLDFSTKLRIAQAISVGILQLHGTPWMSNTVLTLNDIVLLVTPDSTTCELRPFISKPVSDTVEGTPGNMQITHCSNICVPVNCSGSRPFHPTVFSLGLLLLQLVLGRIDDTLDLTTTTITPNKTLQLCNNNIGAMNSIPLLDVSRAHKLAELYEKELQDDVLEKAGDQCRDVINWCLQTWKVTRGLDDGTFCDEFNVEVVEKLEREIRCCS